MVMTGGWLMIDKNHVIDMICRRFQDWSAGFVTVMHAQNSLEKDTKIT